MVNRPYGPAQVARGRVPVVVPSLPRRVRATIAALGSVPAEPLSEEAREALLGNIPAQP